MAGRILSKSTEKKIDRLSLGSWEKESISLTWRSALLLQLGGVRNDSERGYALFPESWDIVYFFMKKIPSPHHMHTHMYLVSELCTHMYRGRRPSACGGVCVCVDLAFFLSKIFKVPIAPQLEFLTCGMI